MNLYGFLTLVAGIQLKLQIHTSLIPHTCFYLLFRVLKHSNLHSMIFLSLITR